MHIDQIKHVLGLSGIQTQEFAWSVGSSPKGTQETAEKGAQIDLLIDQADNTITICEMKFTIDEYLVSQECANGLMNKRERLKETTKTKKAILFAMVSANGVAKGGYWHVVQNILSGDDLFIF